MAFSDRELRLSDADATRIRAGGRHQDFDRGAHLTMQGTRSSTVYLLTRGVVKVASVSSGGNPKLLAIRGRGQLVGESACIDGGLRSGTAVAMTQVSAWEIPGERFLKTLRSDPGLCFAVMQIIVGRVRESDGRIGEFGEFTASDRVERLLAHFGGNCAGPGLDGPIVVPVDQREIAGCAGVARETVSRTITTLADLGIVARGQRGKVVIDDLPALIQRVRRIEES
jgi:CRP-like cAMP-binding protein